MKMRGFLRLGKLQVLSHKWQKARRPIYFDTSITSAEIDGKALLLKINEEDKPLTRKTLLNPFTDDDQKSRAIIWISYRVTAPSSRLITFA